MTQDDQATRLVSLLITQIVLHTLEGGIDFEVGTSYKVPFAEGQSIFRKENTFITTLKHFA